MFFRIRISAILRVLHYVVFFVIFVFLSNVSSQQTYPPPPGFDSNRIQWGNGEYINLQGSGYNADNHIGLYCDPDLGYCDGFGDKYVIKFHCFNPPPGVPLNPQDLECRTNPVTSEQGRVYVEDIHIGGVACGDVIQLDVHDNYCLDGGNNFICGGASPHDYMVWYRECEDYEPYCGDGNKDLNEECDYRDPAASPLCRSENPNACTIPDFCGNGIVDPPTETCEPSLLSSCRAAGSTNECTYCGDSVTQVAAGEQCDDGNTNNLDTCDNSCQGTPCIFGTPSTPQIHPNSPLKDKMTRLSATSTKTIRWQHDGIFPNNGSTNCSNIGEYRFYMTKKDDGGVNNLNMNNTTGCDFTGVTPVVVTNGLPNQVVINNGTSGLDLEWNNGYCWKVEAVNGDQSVSSPTYTFRTNLYPKFVRMGMQFGEMTVDSSDIETGVVTTNASDQNCTSGIANDCTVTTLGEDYGGVGNDFGGVSCWSGKVDFNDSFTDNPITFWFEYDDPDNYDNPFDDSIVNENFRHMFAFHPSDLSGGNLDSGISDMLREDGFNSYHLSIYDLLSAPPANASSGAWEQTSTRVEKYEELGTNKIRIYHEVTFKNLPNGTYDLYSIFESQVLDPLGATSEILADNRNPSLELDNWFSKRGQWAYDGVIPSGSVKSYIRGIRKFDLEWKVLDLHSGVQDGMNVATECKSDEVFLNVELDYIGPDTPFGMTLGDTLIDCTSPQTKDALADSSIGEYISEYEYPGALSGIRGSMSSYFDNACNPGSTVTKIVESIDPWMTTKAGSVYSESHVEKFFWARAEEGESLVYGDEAQNKYIFKDIDPDFTVIGSAFVGSAMSTGDGESYMGAELDSYMEGSDVSPFVDTTDNWVSYTLDRIKNEGLEVSEVNLGSETTINRVSELAGLSGTACNDDQCFYHVSGADLVVGPDGLCDGQYIVISDESLIIKDDFLNETGVSGSDVSGDDACLFIIDKNIQFISENTKSLPSVVNTVPYDVVEGFFISLSSDIAFGMSRTDDLVNFSEDGFFVRGGVISRDMELKRNLGLLNSVQPAEFFMYDPRYMYIFSNVFDIDRLSIRETGVSVGD